MKVTLCTVKGCANHGRYCRRHPAGVAPQVASIKKESKKRAEINKKEYGPKARAFVAARPVCEIQSEVCTKAAKCVHHMRGKNSKEDLLNEKYWMSACFACNNYVEKNDAYARERGWKLSKFSPVKK